MLERFETEFDAVANVIGKVVPQNGIANWNVFFGGHRKRAPENSGGEARWIFGFQFGGFFESGQSSGAENRIFDRLRCGVAAGEAAAHLFEGLLARDGDGE